MRIFTQIFNSAIKSRLLNCELVFHWHLMTIIFLLLLFIQQRRKNWIFCLSYNECFWREGSILSAHTHTWFDLLESSILLPMLMMEECLRRGRDKFCLASDLASNFYSTHNTMYIACGMGYSQVNVIFLK